MLDRQKHLLTLRDWSVERIQSVLQLALDIKKELKENGPSHTLHGRSIALYFEKQSLRTITTFQVGITQLGGGSVILDPESIGIGRRETIEDVSACLGRWVDALVVRCFEQKLLEGFAEKSGIPVINALSDDYHPCQAMAFTQTLMEHWDKDLRGKKITFVGDGNNVANSIAIIAAKLGMHFTLACPNGYRQPKELLDELDGIFKKNGGSYRVENNPHDAVKRADAIYTDVWASMGWEDEIEERKKVFRPFQINQNILDTAPAHCLFSHCLPAHRGEEITNEVMDSPQMICFDEAENRLHAQKAILLNLIASKGLQQ